MSYPPPTAAPLVEHQCGTVPAFPPTESPPTDTPCRMPRSLRIHLWPCPPKDTPSLLSPPLTQTKRLLIHPTQFSKSRAMDRRH